MPGQEKFGQPNLDFGQMPSQEVPESEKKPVDSKGKPVEVFPPASEDDKKDDQPRYH